MTPGPYLYRMSGTTTWRVVEVMLIGGEPVFFLPGVSYSHRPQVGDDFVRLWPERAVEGYPARTILMNANAPVEGVRGNQVAPYDPEKH